jgi:hypothetical protein
MNRAAPRRPDSRPSGPPSPPPPPGEDGEGRSGEDGDDVSPDRRGEVDAMASQTLVLAFFSFSLFFCLPLPLPSPEFLEILTVVWFGFCGALVRLAVGEGKVLTCGALEVSSLVLLDLRSGPRDYY